MATRRRPRLRRCRSGREGSHASMELTRSVPPSPPLLSEERHRARVDITSPIRHHHDHDHNHHHHHHYYYWIETDLQPRQKRRYSSPPGCARRNATRARRILFREDVGEPWKVQLSDRRRRVNLVEELKKKNSAIPILFPPIPSLPSRGPAPITFPSPLVPLGTRWTWHRVLRETSIHARTHATWRHERRID